MNGSAQRTPPPSRRLLLAVFATAAYLAAVIALFGFTSLLANVDVIAEEDAGPLLGPTMVAMACFVTFVALLGVRTGASPLRRALATAASVWVGMLVVGAVGYASTRGGAVWLLLFAGRYATSPYLLGAAVLAAGTVVARWSVDREGHRD